MKRTYSSSNFNISKLKELVSSNNYFEIKIQKYLFPRIVISKNQKEKKSGQCVAIEAMKMSTKKNHLHNESSWKEMVSLNN